MSPSSSPPPHRAHGRASAMLRGHLTVAKSDYLRKRRVKSEAVPCARLEGRISCRIKAALGQEMATACDWRPNQAAQAWTRPMGTPP